MGALWFQPVWLMTLSMFVLLQPLLSSVCDAWMPSSRPWLGSYRNTRTLEHLLLARPPLAEDELDKAAAATAAVNGEQDYLPLSSTSPILSKQKLELLLSRLVFLKKAQPLEISALANSLQPVPVSFNETVLVQGELGDCMYIVESGIYECFLTSNKNKQREILKVYQNKTGEYFGELGLFFRRPRAANIQCISPEGGVLWRMDRDALFEALTETDLGTEVYDLIQNAYKTDTWLEQVTKLSLDDWYDLAVVQSRPKKRPVSLHSFIASLSMAGALITLAPLWDPKWVSEDGLPQIFRYNGQISDETIIQTEWVIFLQAVTAVLGVFRLPPKSPRIRRIGMISAASMTVSMAWIPLSSLGGQSTLYIFDAFSTPGRLLVLGSLLMNCINVVSLLDCIISETPMTGFDSIPGMGNRPAAVLQGLIVYGFVFFIVASSIQVIGSKEAFERLAAPFLQETYRGGQVAGSFVATTYIGLSALLATLQFERKISPATSTILYLLVTVFVTYDTLKLSIAGTFFASSMDSEAAHNFLEVYLPDLYAQTNTFEIYFGILVVTVLNGIRKLFEARRVQDEARNMHSHPLAYPEDDL